MSKKQKNQHLPDIITFIIVALLAAVVVFGVIIMLNQNTPAPNPTPQDARNTNTATSKLQTEDDLQDEDKVAESSNDAKDQTEETNDLKPTVEQTNSGLKVAHPNINYIATEGDVVVVGGDISNINETGGACTIVFTKGDTTVTVSTGILPNPSYISCEAARIEKSKLSAGTWNVQIKYKSNYTEGVSETQSYTIQ